MNSSAVFRFKSIPPLLNSYLGIRASAQPLTVPSLFLARAAELFDNSGARDATWVRSEACIKLVRDSHRYVESLSAQNKVGNEELQLLPGILFSMHRLRGPFSVLPLASLLEKSCLSLLLPRLGIYPPHSLAMIAVALASKGRDGFSKEKVKEISEIFFRPGQGPVTPGGLALLASALSKAGVEEGDRKAQWDAYVSLARVASPLLPKFSHSAIATLCASVSTTQASTTRRSKEARGVKDTREEACLDLLHAIGEECALRLSMAEIAASEAKEESWGKNVEDVEGNEIMNLKDLGVIRDPLQRLDALSQSSKNPATPIHNAQRSEILLPFTLTRILYALATASLFPPHLFSRALQYLKAPPLRTDSSPLSQRMPSSPPHPVPPSKTGSVDGDVAVIQNGDSVDLWCQRDAAVPSPPHHHPTARLSTLPITELARLSWAMARAQTNGQCSLSDTADIWTLLLSRTHDSLQSSLGRRNGGRVGYPNLSGAFGPLETTTTNINTTTHSSHFSTIVWAATQSSAPATPVCNLALHHAAACPQAYTLQALAQLLWAAILQGALSYPGRDNDSPSNLICFKRILEYILLAAEAAMDSHKKGGLDPNTPSDVLASSLLLPSQSGMVKRVQAQLWLSLVGATGVEESTLSSSSTSTSTSSSSNNISSSNSLLSIVPSHVASVWKLAALEKGWIASPPKFLADVSRVLGLAGLAHHVGTPSADLSRSSPWDLHGVLGMGITMPLARQEHSGPLFLDVQGPRHFVNAPLQHFETTPLSRRASSLDWDDSLSHLSALSAQLLPSLSTKVRADLVAQAGCTVVPVNYAEWECRPSTDEKMELLGSKGIPIPKHLY